MFIVDRGYFDIICGPLLACQSDSSKEASVSLLSEFLQHGWSHSFKISPTQGIAVALLEMAKQKVENISFTQGWDGYRMNLAIMEDYKDMGKH